MKVEIIYLGTGSAEGVPALFCECLGCQTAQQLGGKNLRGRQQVLINRELLIDFSPDSFRNQEKEGRFQTSDIKYLLLTHSHSDHLYVADLLQRQEVVTSSPLLVCGSSTLAHVIVPQIVKGSALAYRKLEPFTTYEIGDYRVTPLVATHSSKELCLNYIIDYFGKKYLYIHDSGLLPEITWDFLEASTHVFQAVSLDCNELFGKRVPHHMNVVDNQETKQRLRSLDLVTDQTRFIVSHFSHQKVLPHEELVQRLEALDFITAYDTYTVGL